MSGAEHQYAEITPPRRGAILAIEVDSTARAYDLSALALGGVTPGNAQSRKDEVVVWMQAETNDVFFYFAGGALGSVNGVDIDDVSDTAKITAGNAVAFANTYCAALKAGNAPIRFRLDRRVDRFLVVKAASTSGVVRLWAASGSF